MNDDLIKRSDAISKTLCISFNGTPRMVVFLDDIKAIPPADRPHGKWIEKEYNGIRYYECEKCCGEVLTNYYYYCPWCGVRLKGAEDDLSSLW